MDKRYEVYCLTHPHFYDAPHHGRTRGRFPQAGRPLPTSWAREELDEWLVCRPTDVVLPPQGWKIHVSACPDNAESILEAVWAYRVPRRIAFKFLPGMDALFLANTKYAHRGSSGKFVTVYPVDEAQCACVLTGLGAVLDGRPGPHILSDLRWGGGRSPPCQVRGLRRPVLRVGRRRTGAGGVQVVADRSHGQRKPVGDLTRRRAVPREAQNLQLPTTEPG
nr:hypothetical protein [Streptomyces sp. MZ04]